MMRTEYDIATAMELDEELNESIGANNSDDHSETEKEQLEENQHAFRDPDEGISFKKSVKKKKSACRDYTDQQIEEFFCLLNDVVNTITATEQFDISRAFFLNFVD